MSQKGLASSETFNVIAVCGEPMLDGILNSGDQV